MPTPRRHPARDRAGGGAGAVDVTGDLVDRLDRRFKLLTHGSRAALKHHQTLRSTIDWSYDLLTPTERLALQRLTVFAGGCDLAAAEAVLPDDDLDAAHVVDVLDQLVDKSLVVVDDIDGGVRYRLLETIREYARERLDASGDPIGLRRRHADHYVALAEAAGPHLRAENTSNGPASSPSTSTTSAPRSTGRSTHRLAGARVAPGAPS